MHGERRVEYAVKEEKYEEGRKIEASKENGWDLFMSF